MDRRLGEEKVSFGAWVRRRRRALDLTQAALGKLAACTESAVRKIEADERRPSRRIAGRLADALRVPPVERERFIQSARGKERIDRLDPADDDVAPGDRRAGNLPLTSPSLVGRERELALIAQRLADPACRLLSIVGPGGVGKTRLALAAAAQAAPSFSDGAWVVLLAEAETREMLLSNFARTLEISFSADIDAQVRIQSYLSGKHTLILLDNFEQLLEATQTVAALLDAALRVKFLVTSRERLNLFDEWLLPLGGLDFERGGNGSHARASPAVQLFCERAGRVQPGFPESTDELDHAARICALVEGIPLAIELAAAWVRAMPCRDILSEVQRSATFLRTSSRDIAPRHSSLRAVIDHSVALLKSDERQALARVSVFRTPFGTESAQAVTGATLPQLVALVDKSMLRPLNEGRFAMHELLRQFAGELLSGDPDDEHRVRAAHNSYFLTAFAREGKALASDEVVAAMARVIPVFPDIRAAWLECATRRSYELMADAAVSMFWVYEISSLFHEAVQFLGQTLEQLSTDPEIAQSRSGRYVMSWSNVFCGWFLVYKGEFEESLRHSLAAAEWILPLGRNIEYSICLSTAAVAALNLGRSDQARSMIELAVASETGSSMRPGLASGYQVSIGIAYLMLGEFDEARKRLLRTLQLQPGPWSRGGAHFLLGDIAMRSGRLEEAQRHGEEMARNWMELYERHPQRVLGLLRLGRVALARGDSAGARAYFEQALRESRDIGFPPYIAHALGQLGRIDLAEGKVADALLRQQEALQVSLASGNRIGVIRALIHSALAYKASGERDRAYGAWHEAAERALEAGLTNYAAQAIDAMSAMAQAPPVLADAGSPISPSRPAVEQLREHFLALPRSLGLLQPERAAGN